MRLTLRARILLLIAGAITALTAVILLVVATAMRHEVDHVVQNDVRATGGVLAALVSERSASLKKQCLLFVRQPVFKAYLGASEASEGPTSARPDAATIGDSLGEYLHEMGADAALVTDRDGKVLGQTDVPAGRRSDGVREAGIVAAIHGTTWSGVVARKGRLTLAVTVPVLINGEVWGTFAAYEAIDSQLARDLNRALGSDVAFVDHGKVVGASLPAPPTIATPQGAPIPVTVAGRPYFALYAPLPDTAAKAGMGFVALRSVDRALALYDRIRRLLVAIFVVTLVLALCAGVGLARSVTNPLNGVVEAARTLQAGGWPDRFEVRRADEIGLLQSVFNDMTDALHTSQERLLALIDIDPLTELDNHRRFQERLIQEMNRRAASGEALVLMLIDLDHFQDFNSRHGHAAGDAALKRVAELLRKHLPDVSVAARFGGDEFAALLPDHTWDATERLAEMIRGAAGNSLNAATDGEGLSISIGYVEVGARTANAEALVLAAELAVSQAKQLGRNRVCRFENLPVADDSMDAGQLYRFLKDGSIATIQALAAAVDAKDPYTRGHSHRVAEYAAALARNVGRPESEVELIFITGTLHDVGKIGVPDAVLQKAGQLDAEERAVMETHAVLGEVIVRKAPQLTATLPGVRCHHERWDGTGYPDRLTGEEIPTVARFLAIADTYDAMTSDRPYRKGMSADVALAEIARGAGLQFDPALAQAFVAMMRTRMGAARAA